jgi:hypothetical protein
MNMRKRICLSSTTALIILAMTPNASYADAAMDACIQAFVAERIPKDRTIKIRKFSGSNPSTAAERITLTAKGAKSGTEIASATCIVSDGGASISLHETQDSTAATASAKLSR